MGDRTGGLTSFGIGLTKLRAIAKQVGRDHDLALKLCDERNHDAKIICPEGADGDHAARALGRPDAGRATALKCCVDLIRFGGRVDYVDLVSSSFVEESLQVLGGVRISIRGSLVAAGERPVAI